MAFRRHQRRTVLYTQPSPSESYHMILSLSLMGARHARISLLKVYRAVEGGWPTQKTQPPC